MSKKQTFTPIINKEGDFQSPNRRTYREFMAKGLKTDRLNTVPYKREEPKVMNGRTKKERKDLAKEFGSTGTNLKKKHIHRERLETGYYPQFDSEEMVQLVIKVTEAAKNKGLNNE